MAFDLGSGEATVFFAKETRVDQARLRAAAKNGGFTSGKIEIQNAKQGG